MNLLGYSWSIVIDGCMRIFEGNGASFVLAQFMMLNAETVADMSLANCYGIVSLRYAEFFIFFLKTSQGYPKKAAPPNNIPPAHTCAPTKFAFCMSTNAPATGLPISTPIPVPKYAIPNLVPIVWCRALGGDKTGTITVARVMINPKAAP